jgi:hypothetical protein
MTKVFEEVFGQRDTLGLYNMLYDTVLCGGTGVNSFGKLRQQWHSLRMYDPRTNEII